MQIIYEFSRQEIKSRSIANFQSLFGIDRLKASALTNPTLLPAAVGSIKIYFQRESNGPLHYEDPDIRALCDLLIKETPAVLLSSTDDRTLKLLFYCTMNDFEVIHTVPGGHSYGFHSKGPAAIKHLKFFQKRLSDDAKKLSAPSEVVAEHSARVSRMFPCS